MNLAFHKMLNFLLPRSITSFGRRLALLFIPSMRHLDMPTRLEHLASLGFTPRVIFDIGCSDGQWARLAAHIWPEAQIFGFEPNHSRRGDLEQAKQELPHFDYQLCFLGPERRTIKYKDHNCTTSLFRQDTENDSSAEMLVLDDLLKQGGLPLPDLIKADVEGYEMEVLRGGSLALEHAQALLLEVNLLKVEHLSHSNFGRIPTFDLVLDFCREHGFALYDIVSAYRRPDDDALAQLDVLLVRDGHSLRSPTLSD